MSLCLHCRNTGPLGCHWLPSDFSIEHQWHPVLPKAGYGPTSTFLQALLLSVDLVPVTGARSNGAGYPYAQHTYALSLTMNARFGFNIPSSFTWLRAAEDDG